MTFAVHHLHAPAVPLVGSGYTLDGKHVIPLPTPLFVAPTREEAEAWRRERQEAQHDRP